MKNKRLIIPLAAAALILIAAVIYTVFALTGNTDKHIAEITLDGQVIREVDLSTAQDETFTVANGTEYNIVRIENGSISVTEASCPDKICIQHGELRSELLPIVCLPNKLVITLR